MKHIQAASRSLKVKVLISVAVILVLTVLELPSPVGFETRPQGNVSYYWLLLFLTILVTEILTVPLIFKRPKIGAKLGIMAGILNIVQVLADQLHLLQPEAASFGYSLLEMGVAAGSLGLIYFSLKTGKLKKKS